MSAQLDDLEPQICGIDNMADLAAMLVNNLEMTRTKAGEFIVRRCDIETLGFAINQINGMATKLRSDFYQEIEGGAE